MKLVSIIGNMSHYDFGLNIVCKQISSVLEELGVNEQKVDLGVMHPPYYDGETTRAIDGIVANIKEADGVIIACTSQLFAPSAILQNFLEYLEHVDYKDVLRRKYVLLVVVSQNGGERNTLDYLSRVVGCFSGYVVGQIGLRDEHMKEIDSGGDAAVFIDKSVEDFYRAVNSSRKYIIPRDYYFLDAITTVEDNRLGTASPLTPAAEHFNRPQTSFTDQQEQEVDELSRLFSEKYGGETVTHAPQFVTPLSASSVAQARPKTVQQITQNLPRYYQPQLSAGLQCIIQLNITGVDAFEGFLHIHSTECSYTEGVSDAPDIIIMADQAVWFDVLKGKNSAQKAFMIGGIKVRGDFVLLTKFDSLFKLENV